jgi:LPXTG-motif cell wall-anchored protein
MDTNQNYMNQMPLPGSQPKTGGVGTIIAVVIIVVALAFGGWYFWNQAKERVSNNNVNSELQATTSDGISAELEADLRAMQNDDLGESDMESVDSEFQQ